MVPSVVSQTGNDARSGTVKRMGQRRSALFRGRHFRDEIIVLCLRWYLRYPLSYRDLEEMMVERGLTMDHSTIARWVLRYAPVLNERIRSEMRRPNRSWRCDETYIRVAGQWTYLYRAIDSSRQHHRFPALTKAGSRRGQSVSAACGGAGRPHPAAGDQRGRPSGVPGRLLRI